MNRVGNVVLLIKSKRTNLLGVALHYKLFYKHSRTILQTIREADTRDSFIRVKKR